ETKRVFSKRNAKKFECYERNDNLDQIVKKTTEEHNLRKEIKLLFFNKNNKVYKPIFKVDNKEFKLESIIYNKNQKKAYLELTGEGNSYFLFSVDPTKVEFKE
ncbi:MAG: hypothetical protein KDK36_10810, partial [Leptospiraceae bacterium]|nr:hypothetical protein [Leptospiraceae bacterium]